jgi:hypothetical protein
LWLLLSSTAAPPLKLCKPAWLLCVLPITAWLCTTKAWPLPDAAAAASARWPIMQRTWHCAHCPAGAVPCHDACVTLHAALQCEVGAVARIGYGSVLQQQAAARLSCHAAAQCDRYRTRISMRQSQHTHVWHATVPQCTTQAAAARCKAPTRTGK